MAEIIRRLACGNINEAMREIQEEMSKRPPAVWDCKISHDDGCPCLDGKDVRWCNCSPDVVATKLSNK